MREKWIDIAKGIGIILVVIGHSGNSTAHHYLFWFHMPLFFIISGYLHKPLKKDVTFNEWAIKRIKTLIIPYISFCIGIFLFIQISNVINSSFDIMSATKEALKIIYGGRMVGGAYAVIWFVTCLLATHILFGYLYEKIKNKYVILIVLLLSYIMAHLEPKEISIPLNLDVTFLAVVYFAVGFYLKKWNINEKLLIASISLPLAIAVILFERAGFIKYELDMKHHLYNNMILDFVVPVTFSIALIVMCKFVTNLVNLQVIEYVGRNSLIIMYLHMGANLVFQHYFNYGPVYYTVVGLVVPLAINYIFLERSKTTKMLFQGAPRVSSTK